MCILLSGGLFIRLTALCASAAEASVTFGSNAYEAAPGSTFPVGVYIRTDSGAAAYRVTLQYDTAHLRYVDGADEADAESGTLVLAGEGGEPRFRYWLRFAATGEGEGQIRVTEAEIAIPAETAAGEEDGGAAEGEAAQGQDADAALDTGGQYTVQSLNSAPVRIAVPAETEEEAQEPQADGEENGQTAAQAVDGEAAETAGAENGRPTAQADREENGQTAAQAVDGETAETAGAENPAQTADGEEVDTTQQEAQERASAGAGDSAANVPPDGGAAELEEGTTASGGADVSAISLPEQADKAERAQETEDGDELPEDDAEDIPLIFRTWVAAVLAALAALVLILLLEALALRLRRALRKRRGERRMEPRLLDDGAGAGEEAAEETAEETAEGDAGQEPVAQDEELEILDEAVIAIRDVTMEFHLASAEPSGLKDYLIRTLRREITYRKLYALYHVSFNVYRGEVVGIIGTNGSGKSTLVKIVSGALKPTGGKVEVNRRKVQLLTLGTGFDNELTARENVYLNGAIIGYSRAFLDRHYQDIVNFAELSDFMEEKVKNFSSGMRSRLGFAIATAGKAAEILILDEVLSVGDEFFKKKSLKRIKEMIHGGSTVLLVSHSMGTIIENCSKCVWIEKGELKMIGEPREVCGAYQQYGGPVAAAG